MTEKRQLTGRIDFDLWMLVNEAQRKYGVKKFSEMVE